jgi:PleD family two-component response regulator
VKAIDTTPCEIAPGEELPIHVSCGVAEYRFGSGADGVLMDADKAMYAAKDSSRRETGSHICYRNELDVPARAPRDGFSIVT